jgi:signal transduction histidine kinase
MAVQEPTLSEPQLRRLIEAGRALVAHLDLERVLDDLLEIAAEITGARYAAIGVLAEDRRSLERFLTLGVDELTRQAIGDLPHGRGILGVLVSDARPLRLDDIGGHPQSFGFPNGHPPMTTFLGVPIMIRDAAWGNLYLTEKAGGEPFTASDEEAAVILADWAAIAVQNARLYQRVQERRHELERAVQGLEATTAIARAVGSETDLTRVLELIVKRGRALVDARSMVLLLSEGDELVVSAIAGQVRSDARATRIPMEGTAAGEVLASGRPERLPDVQARLALDEEGMGIIGAETGLLVPLRYRNARLGVLAAFDRLSEDPCFGDEQETLMLSFAASAATAVATAKSVARERLRHSLDAAEKERRRWARELHDETLQALGALRMMLSSGLKRSEPEALARAVRTAVEQIQGEIVNLRTLITELRPAALDDLGLAPAIESLVTRVSAVEGLDIAARVELAGQRLEGDVETAVYRVVQEALSNVAKHAQAEHVRVRVAREGDEILIEVADDGRGFDPQTPSQGFGLVGMRERADLHGGVVGVESRPGEGTTVQARLPLGAALPPPLRAVR